MSTISNIEIEGFLSFKHKTIDLKPGVNVVAGANRQGKTNVLRALRWVLLNDGPTYSDTVADDNLRHGRGEAKVSQVRVRVTYDNGSWVERRRSSSDNLYVLHYADGREEEHSGIGRGFYEPVAEITGFRPVDCGADNVLLGWQGASDPKLLVGESAQVVDRQLTRMIGANVPEEAVAAVRSDLRDTQKEVKGHEATVEDLGARVEALAGVDRVQEVVEASDIAVSQAEAMEQATVLAAGAYTQLTTAQKRLGPLTATINVVDGIVADAAAVLEAATHNVRVVEEASRLCQQREATVARLVIGGPKLEGAKSAAEVAATLLLEAQDLSQMCQQAADATTNLFEIVDKQQDVNGAIGRWESEATDLKAAIDAELEANPACPHCGRLGQCPHCGRSTVLEGDAG